MLSNGPITVYVKSIVNRSEVWTKRQVSEALWQDRRAVRQFALGDAPNDKITVYVSLTRDDEEIKAGDILVKGLVSEEISSTFTASALRKKYPESFIVRESSLVNFGIMKHRKVVGS